MADTFDEGDSVKVTGTYKDAAEALHDPGAVFLDIDWPDGTNQTFEYTVDAEITRESLGLFNATFDTAGKPGRWFYRWYSTGVGQAADEGEFVVNPKRL